MEVIDAAEDVARSGFGSVVEEVKVDVSLPLGMWRKFGKPEGIFVVFGWLVGFVVGGYWVLGGYCIACLELV